MTPQTFIFFGRVGSGKGTQAKLLIDELQKRSPEIKSIYIETGEKLRDFVKSDNYSAKKTKDVLGSGSLMPSFIPIWLWAGHLVEHFTGKEHLIFDGTCRRLYEATVLDTALKFYSSNNTTVIIIDTSVEWSIDKALGRGRSDDDISKIKRRSEWFDKEVVPVINFFENDSSYKTFHINGEQTIEQVHQDIVNKLGW